MQKFKFFTKSQKQKANTDEKDFNHPDLELPTSSRVLDQKLGKEPEQKNQRLQNKTKTKGQNSKKQNDEQSSSNNKKITCQICLQQCAESQYIPFSTCNHSFCVSCLNSYLFQKIQNFQNFSCPSQQCDQLIDLQGTFFSSLPPQVQQKTRKTYNYHLTMRNEHLKLCPNQLCHFGVIEVKEDEKNMKCRYCEKEFCQKCLLPAHQQKCKKVEKINLQKNLHLRKCEKCKTILERSEGCRKMQCRCGYEFCYICGIRWPGYDHTHTAEEQFGLEGDLNANIQLQKQVVWPKGKKLAIHILLCVLLSIPFLISLFVLAFMQLIIFVLIILKLIFIGLVLEPWLIILVAPHCGTATFLYALIFPLLMVCGIFKSIYQDFGNQMDDLLFFFKLRMKKLVKLFFYP